MLRILFQELNNLIQLAKSQCCNRISATVIDGNPTGGRIIKRGTGEGNVGHISYTLVIGLG
jgi:hypothetical protein